MKWDSISCANSLTRFTGCWNGPSRHRLQVKEIISIGTVFRNTFWLSLCHRDQGGFYGRCVHVSFVFAKGCGSIISWSYVHPVFNTITWKVWTYGNINSTGRQIYWKCFVVCTNLLEEQKQLFVSRVHSWCILQYLSWRERGAIPIK